MANTRRVAVSKIAMAELKETITGIDELHPALSKVVDFYAGNQGIAEITIKLKSKRTSQQNRALHKGFKIAGDKLAAAGITKEVFYRDVSKNHTFLADESDVKETARAIAQMLFGEHSTTKIPPNKVGEVWELLGSAISERLNVDIGDLPSLDGQRIKSIIDNDWPGSVPP